MALTTRTLNPLPFNDLEPHRFEDLVRQLAYDFRPWRKLEAIGRSGSDEGQDIRGVEAVAADPEDIRDSERAKEDDEEFVDASGPSTGAEDRLWIIQCKREKSIGPAKARKIVVDFFKTQPGTVYGYILAAACDFSRATRDAVRDEVAKNGAQEYHCWGKGELEDQLFQPKNDHLLFAYFGISLQIRRRSIRTTFRSHLALKKKLIKHVGSLEGITTHRAVLIRDPRDEKYPFVGDDIDAFMRDPAWRYFEFHGHEPPDHVAFLIRKRLAYVNWPTEEWDIIEDVNLAIPFTQDVYGLAHVRWDHQDKTHIAHAYCQLKVPSENLGYLHLIGAISYERILLLDELGDACNPGPHILVEYDEPKWPFDRSWAWIESTTDADRSIRPDESKRIAFFPKPIPDVRNELAEQAKRSAAVESMPKRTGD